MPVDVRGVDEVAARLDEGVQDLVARLLVDPFAEHHRAEAQLAHLKARPAEKSIFHGG
jgi:hypothetical protein